jgi:hypothetical protein
MGDALSASEKGAILNTGINMTAREASEA